AHARGVHGQGSRVPATKGGGQTGRSACSSAGGQLRTVWGASISCRSPATTESTISNNWRSEAGQVEDAREGRDLLNSENGDLVEYSVRLLQRRGVRFVLREPDHLKPKSVRPDKKRPP